MNELIGRIWPGWEIDELIGRGAYGQVYRIRRSDVGEIAYGALKVMRIPSDEGEFQSLAELGMSDAEMYTYLRGTVNDIIGEITLMERLKGAPNVVSIEDYYLLEHEGAPAWTIFIRMELLESLSHYINRVGFPDTEGAVRMGIDILRALESCERQRIIHRDIKPDNIFISRFGEFKLGDFGIARQVEAGSKTGYTTKGTPPYMSPEMVRGDHYDNTVDIYSLGIVLYRYLNQNRFPFLPLPPSQITRLDMEEAQIRRISGEALPPPVMADRSLAAIICTACDPEPSGRYQSASEFREALEDWLAGEWKDPSGEGLFRKLLTVILIGTALAAAGILVLNHIIRRDVTTGSGAESETAVSSLPEEPESGNTAAGDLPSSGTAGSLLLSSAEYTDYEILDYSFTGPSYRLLAAYVTNTGEDAISFTVHFQPKTRTERNETVTLAPVEVYCEALPAGASRFLYSKLTGSEAGDEYDWESLLSGIEKTTEEPSVSLEVELNEPESAGALGNDNLSFLVTNTGSAAVDPDDVVLFLFLKDGSQAITDVIEKPLSLSSAGSLLPGESEPTVFKSDSIKGSYDPEVFWGAA